MKTSPTGSSDDSSNGDNPRWPSWILGKVKVPASGPRMRITGVALWLLPVTTRVPLKFGTESLSSVICARVRVQLVNEHGRIVEGWGETPLSVQWVWPSSDLFGPRQDAMIWFAEILANAWMHTGWFQHPLEQGVEFNEAVLPRLWQDFNASRTGDSMPWLAALVVNSAFDVALHDAAGVLRERATYSLYGGDTLSTDLAAWLKPDSLDVSFVGKYPGDFLATHPVSSLTAWHLVGGLDPITPDDLTGAEPGDGYPVLLHDWITNDGLKCLKVKLRGNDSAWDRNRMKRIGDVARIAGVEWLTADFNCTVRDPVYVVEILEQLRRDEPWIWERLRYVEQPFPYDLEANPIDVHCVSRLKPLFLDESAHDWRIVRLGRELGWSGVALKTCKTQSGALLTAAWARAHGMELMVQDLTNPMLAQIPHCLLAAHVGTIGGVETNAMQFYPEASSAEAAIHPGLYRRRQGMVDLSSLAGPGFGYRIQEIQRSLPSARVMLG